MEFKIINLSPESDFESLKDSLNSEYMDSLFGMMQIIVGGHSETIDYMFFLELQQQLSKIITGQSNMADYYDVDDFGFSYRKDNNPYIRFSVKANRLYIKYRWDEQVYSCSWFEFKSAYEAYLNQLQILLKPYGVKIVL